MFLLRLLLLLLIFASSSLAASDWITYERCILENDHYFDGDSFQVRTQSPTTGRDYTYVFRLYGADCAETDTRFPERLAEQAKEFQRPVDEMVGWGEKAKEFTAKFLSRPFTVITCKQDARGGSAKNRYYAIILGSDGRDLAETLVRSGLARAFGVWPAGAPKVTDAARYRRDLERDEAQSRADHTGIWSKTGTNPAATPSIFKSKLPFGQ